MAEKAEMISSIISLSMDTNGFYNPLRVKVFLTLETVYNYTNLSFTEKMKENGMKLYDTFISSGLFDEIVKNIPADEWKDLQDSVWHTISNIYDYKNSVMGVLEAATTEYSDLELDVNKLKEGLTDPESLKLLKDIVVKLG
jgi:hypothetical protein